MNDTDDWYETTALTDGIDAVDTPHARTSRVFVVHGSEATVVVDAGRGIGDLRGYLGLDASTRLVLTHSHWDHVGNAHQFANVSIDRRERNSDGSVTLDVVSEVFLKRPGQFMDNHLDQGRPLPEGVDPETFDIPPVPAADTHADGDLLDVGDHELELVGIPGHTGGQTGVLSRSDGVFLAADLVHVDRNLYVHFDDSDLAAYIESFDDTIDRWEAGEFDVLATAHNEPMDRDEIDLLYRLRDGLVSIADGDRAFERVETNWGPANEYEVGDSTVLVSPDE